MGENMFDDLFGELFGDKFNENFNKIFGNQTGNQTNKSQQPKNNDPIINALLKTFNDEIKKGDKAFLEKAIIDYRLKVYERVDNKELIETYTRAAIYVGNNKISYESITKIKNPEDKHKEVQGLIAYAAQDFNTAINCFEQIKTALHNGTRIPYSISLFETGTRDINIHEQILSPILEKTQLANSIIGCILSEESKYDDAEKYFRAAANINPNSERTRLDLLRIMFINNKIAQIYQDMNSFYIDTASKLTFNDLDKELKERVLKVPKIRINNLYNIADNILR